MRAAVQVSSEEDCWLTVPYSTKSSAECGELFGRTKGAVLARANSLGLTVKPEPRRMARPREGQFRRSSYQWDD